MMFDIEKIARLAFLKLRASEKKQFADQLPQILDYVGQLNEVDTSFVDTRAYLSEQSNIFRADEVLACPEDERRSSLGAFPEAKADALQVPGIFE